MKKSTRKPYKVCFLGYSKLSETARQVIADLPDSDVEYILLESNLENLDTCVHEALQLGCTVFIAGPGNAAKFSTNYAYPLVQIPLRSVDYIRALRDARRQNGKKICIVRHRYSRPVDLAGLGSVMEMSLQELTFESFDELRESIRHSDCDTFIGATMATEIATSLGKTGILLYSGRESIEYACTRAGELAKDLYETRQMKEITNAILNNAQFGIIVTDAEGRVNMFNRTAQRFTGVAASQIRGQMLTDFFPNLSIAPLLKSPQTYVDAYRLVEGAMMRCVQERIMMDRRTIGVLLTIYPDSRKRKKSETTDVSFTQHICRWDDLVTDSPIMKKTVEQGKNLATLNYPTTLLGASGSGRETIAYCIHASSRRAQSPCITIDLATVAEDDIPHVLMGYEKNDRSVSGMLASANGGSLVIKNISAAKPAARACLMQVLTSRQVFRPGMAAPLLLDLVIYTIMSPQEYQELPADFRSSLSICQLEIPSLKQRKEDIGPLFLQNLARNSDYPHRPNLTEAMQELLTFYSWPGELRELSAVSLRYALAMARVERPTPKTQYLLLLQAIGEEAVFQEILAAHPALMQRPITDKDAFLSGILELKKLMKYSNDTLAEKLNISRTTIWRALQSVTAGTPTEL